MLLGPNGAGKTTALRIITGALPPTTGTVRVFDLDLATHGNTIRQRCGIVPARPALYDRLSGWDNLRYAAELYQLPRSQQMQAMRAAADRFDITDALDRPAGQYSTGMRARLALARSVLHAPELLLLDEPTAGLDPESSRAVLHLIGEYSRTGVTIVMNTHLLVEAEGLADHVIIMDSGVALESGDPNELRTTYFPHRVCDIEATENSALVAALNELSIPFESTPSGVAIRTENQDIPSLISSLTARGVALQRINPHVPSLDELYFEIRRVHGKEQR